MDTWYRRVELILCVVVAVAFAASAGAGTISEAKLALDDTPCDLQSAVVSAVFDGFFYVEADNRACGIRVVSDATGIQAGMRADVSGTVQTSTTGERLIQAGTLSANGTGSVAPLAMTVRSLSTGLDTAGLLVRVSGKVASRDVQSGSFVLDDGSNILVPGSDGELHGVPVLVGVNAGATSIPVPGSFVTVTGISSREAAGGVGSHVLLLGNIQLIKVGPPEITITGPSMDLTTAGPVTYTITYDGAESITLSAADVTLNKVGTADGVVTISGDGPTTRTVTISDITGDGSLSISLAAGTAINSNGDPALPAGPSAIVAISSIETNRMPWPMLGHDRAHTGRTTAVGPSTPTELWETILGKALFAPERSAPAIGRDGTIYACAGDAKICAINPDGTKKWDSATAGSSWGCAAVGIDETVYAGDNGSPSTFYALNPDGTKKWQCSLASVFGGPVYGADGTIYVPSSTLYALNSDGTERWEFAAAAAAYSSPALGADGTIYFESSDKKLYAVNPDGTKKWEYLTAGWPSGGYGASSPTIGADGTIYAGTSDSKLLAINPDGSKKWELVAAGQLGMPAIDADGTLYVGSSDRKLYAVNPDGTEKWEFLTGGYVAAPAIGGDGTVYVGASTGKLYAVNPDGTAKWDFTTPASIVTQPSIGADGTVYVIVRASGNLVMYAIGPGVGPGVGAAISPPSADATDNGPVIYTVTYTGAASVYLEASDVVLNKTGTADGTVSVSGDGSTRTVTISNTTGDGTLGISLHGGTAFDAAGRPCAAAGPSETFVIVHAPLSVSISGPSQAASNYWPVSYTVTYAGAAHVTLQAGDITLNKTATARGTVTVSGSGTFTRQVTISNLMGDGTLGISVAAGTATDLAGDPVGATGPSGTFAVTVGNYRSSWWMYNGNPAHNCQSTAIGPSSPVLKWVCSFPSGTPCSAAIAADGTVYTGSYPGSLCAINADGTSKWVFAPPSQTPPPAIGSDGTVYVGSSWLYAVNPDGTLKWTGLNEATSSAAAIGADGTIYACTGSYLYAYDVNGTRKWTFAGGGTCPPAIGPDGTIYVGSATNAHKLYAVNPDGTEKWEYLAGGDVSGVASVGSDGCIYYSTVDYTLRALRPDGTQKWQVGTGNRTTTPAIAADGTIYVACYDGRLLAYSSGGVLKWGFTAGLVPAAPAIGRDGTVYVAGAKIFAVNPDGTEKWEYLPFGGAAWSLSMGPDGTVYAASTDRKLYAIGPGGPNVRAAIGAPSSATTAGDPVSYTVTYTDAATVTLQLEDIVLNRTGTANGVVSVSGSGSESRTVTVSDVTGDGTLGITIAGYTAFDAAGNPAPPAGPSATVIVATTPPSASISAPSVPSTSFHPVTFTVTYERAASVGLSASDVTLNTTGTARGTVSVSGSGNATRTVMVSDIQGDGTISISLAAGTAVNLAGVPAPATGPSTAFNVSCTALARMPWPMWGHDPAHTGRTNAVGPDTPSELWNAIIAQSCMAMTRLAPVIGRDDTIYTGTGGQNIRALNPDGTDKWDFTQYRHRLRSAGGRHRRNHLCGFHGAQSRRYRQMDGRGRLGRLPGLRLERNDLSAVRQAVCI